MKLTQQQTDFFQQQGYLVVEDVGLGHRFGQISLEG